METLAACFSAFVAGFFYFLGAVPLGKALGLPLWLAALSAWLGYSTGAVVVAYGGAPLREWMLRRFKVQPQPEKPNAILRAWRRFGLPGLGLLAPVTVGPQLGALLAIVLGAPKARIVLAIALGAIPWAVAFAVLVGLGVNLAR